MKKTLALILAAMMVAGTASVAFANAPEVTIGQNGGTYYVWDKEDSRYEVSEKDYVEYGDKIALELTGEDAQEKKEVTKNKVFPDWKVGSDLVESAEIKYVKVYAPTVHTDRFVLSTDKIVAAEVQLDGVVGSAQDKDKIVATVAKDAFKSLEDTIYKDSEESKARDAMKALLSDSTVTIENKTESSRSVKYSDLASDNKTAVVDAIFAAAKKAAKETTYNSEYKYMVVITLKDSTSTKVKDLAGDIRVGKTLTAAKNDAEAGNKFELDLEVKHFSEEAGSSANDSITVVCDKNNVNHVLEIEDDADVTDIEFGNGGELALFTVNLDGQSDVNVGYSTKFDADIAAKYPDANLEFIKWTASPVFNRTGDLYIYADEDTFIYEVTADGLKEVSKAEYDEDYGAWYLRTRKLGSYVISDTELDLSASSSSQDASSSGTSSSNPSTGGTTGTTGGNPGDKYNPNTGR